MDEKLDLKLPIIIDVGSGEIKAGFSGDEQPKLIFKNYIGEPKFKKILSAFSSEDKELNIHYIGDDCDKYMGILRLKHPVKNGIFSNEQDVLILFNYIYSKLGLNTEEIESHPLLITEPLLNPYNNRERIANTLFGNLGVPAIFFASQPILSLFSTSNTSGTVLESGEGVTQSCVVCEGYSLPNSYERFDYGGGDVTNYLKMSLKKKGYQFNNSTEIRLVEEIKENLCFFLNNKNISRNDAIKALNKNPINYYLPDGSSVSIGEERLLAPEILFDLGLIGKEYLNLTDIIMSSINKVDLELRRKAYENILVTGGNTKIKGLLEKLTDEIKNKVNKNTVINVNTTKKSEYCCWMGGNILTTQEIFKKMWVSKREWDENGNKIIHLKTI